MKRIIYIVVGLMLLIWLAACSKEIKNVPDWADTESRTDKLSELKESEETEEKADGIAPIVGTEDIKNRLSGSITGYVTEKQIKIIGICWNLKENVLYLEDDLGASEWNAFRIVNRDNEFFQEWVIPYIKEIQLQDSVSILPPEAFYHMAYVEKVDLGNSLKYIGEFAFCGCRALREIEIPETVETIGWAAFLDCSRLQSINLPEQCKDLGEDIIANCPCLVQLKIAAASGLLYAGEGNIRYYQLIDTDGMSEEEYDAIHIKRLIITGEVIQPLFLEAMKDMPIEQLVFTANPPEEWDVPFTAEDGVTIYYREERVGEWAPNGETEWNGFPIVGIDSLDDLPPLA